VKTAFKPCFSAVLPLLAPIFGWFEGIATNGLRQSREMPGHEVIGFLFQHSSGVSQNL
jgi:hypothetical protein